MAPLAKAEGFAVIAYGENASDIGDYRPGAQAAGEFQVRAPLKEAGLTKPEIRRLSTRLGLPTGDKPQMACLSSRIPYGEAVTPEKLRMIEQAENVLRDLGFFDVRVRHHELPMPNLQFPIGNAAGSLSRPPQPAPRMNPQPALAKAGPRTPPLRHLARIEVEPGEMRKLIEDGVLAKVAVALKRIGYAHVTLDLEGYRRGSANETMV